MARSKSQPQPCVHGLQAFFLRDGLYRSGNAHIAVLTMYEQFPQLSSHPSTYRNINKYPPRPPPIDDASSGASACEGTRLQQRKSPLCGGMTFTEARTLLWSTSASDTFCGAKSRYHPHLPLVNLSASRCHRFSQTTVVGPFSKDFHSFAPDT